MGKKKLYEEISVIAALPECDASFFPDPSVIKDSVYIWSQLAVNRLCKHLKISSGHILRTTEYGKPLCASAGKIVS